MITTATACKLKEAHKGTTPQRGSGNTTRSKGNSGAASSHKSKKKKFKPCKYISKQMTTDTLLTANNVNVTQTREISN